MSFAIIFSDTVPTNLVSNQYQQAKRQEKKPVFMRVSEGSEIIPTRCRNSQLNEFCLGIICSCSSENFDSPYYRSCTMEAYQNLISGDKSLLGYMVIALVGLIVL